jgi:hypothetical protein
MIFRLSTCIALLPLIATLAACEAMPTDARSELAPASGPFTPHPLKLMVNGMPVDDALGSEAAMSATLDLYGVPRPAGATLGEWIKAIRAEQTGHGPKINGGPGGVSPRSLLDAADEALDNGNYRGAPTVDIHGQIEKECTLEDGTVVPGYWFDGTAAHGRGHLCVTVYTTTRRGNSSHTKTIAERFFVVVNPLSKGVGGFMVEPKTLTGDPKYKPDDVFPNFGRASKLKINENTASGFNFKLWASGKSIRIAGIWADKNYDPARPDFKWVFHKPEYASLRIPNDESCIDMMFEAAPPSPHMSPTMSPPQYCLGRCSNPPILNTR